jgi:ADP-ribose pyrophosphatase
LAEDPPTHLPAPGRPDVARDCTPGHALAVDDYEDCEPVEMDVDEVRAELRAGRMTGSELAYLALDHAGLL